MINVVPFGISDEHPTATRKVLKGVVPGIGEDDKVILWGGGVYNWFDPLTLIHAVDRLRTRVPDVRLFFMGMKHPNPSVPAMQMASRTRRLAQDLGLVGEYVFFNEEWVAYTERQNFLLEADIGVSTHLDHVETAFSFRTRILDYLWTSLPIVATSGDSFADLIEHHGLGITGAARRRRCARGGPLPACSPTTSSPRRAAPRSRRRCPSSGGSACSNRSSSSAVIRIAPPTSSTRASG